MVALLFSFSHSLPHMCSGGDRWPSDARPPWGGACKPQIECFCLWFYGNLISAHLGSCLEAGLKWSNRDATRKENNIPWGLREKIPHRASASGVGRPAGGTSMVELGGLLFRSGEARCPVHPWGAARDSEWERQWWEGGWSQGPGLRVT